MTQVKRGHTGNAVASRKQQRFSLLKLAGALLLMCGLVVLLARNDPFPGVRKAAMRHRRQSETTIEEDVVDRDFRNPKTVEEKSIVEKEDLEDTGGSQEEENSDAAAADGSRIYTLELASLQDGKTGKVVLQTKPEWAPLGVAHFHELMDADFYKDAKFFRVVDDFVVQFGIPALPKNQRKTPIQDDPVLETNARGTLTYATSGKNTRTTQLFINTRKGGNKFLDGQGFSPIAEILEGMEYVDAIYAKYGEKPSQGKIQQQGNTYLDKEFPLMSYISKTYQGKSPL